MEVLEYADCARVVFFVVVGFCGNIQTIYILELHFDIQSRRRKAGNTFPQSDYFAFPLSQDFRRYWARICRFCVVVVANQMFAMLSEHQCSVHLWHEAQPKRPTDTHLLLITAFQFPVAALKASGHTISKHTRIAKSGRTPDNGKYAQSLVYLAGAEHGTCSNDFRHLASANDGEQVRIIHWQLTCACTRAR